MNYLNQFRQRYSEYDDLSDQDLMDGLYRNNYSDMDREVFNTRMVEEVPIPDDEGEINLGTSVGAGVDILQQGLYSAAEGVGESLDVDFLKEFGREGVERQKEELAEATGLQQFREIGGVGDTAEFAIEQIGQQIPIMAPMLAGSIAGAKIGAGLGTPGGPIGAGLGGFIGGVAGGALASIPLFYGQNRERQKEVSGAVQSEGAAALTAIPQAALESVIGALTLGVGKLGAPALTNALYSGGGLLTRAARGFGGGALVEMPTEIGQQALERTQAGLEVFSEDAIPEYVDAAGAALFVGGAFGSAGNVAFGNRQTLAEMRAEADDTALKSDLDTLLINESVEVDDLTDQEIMEFAERNRENDPLFAYIVDSGLAEPTKIKTLRRRMSEVFTGVLSENQIRDPFQADGYNPLQIAEDQADRRGPALGTFQDVDTDGTVREETVVANRGTDPATLLLSDEETIQVAAQYAERHPEINEILKAEVEPKVKVRLLRRKLRELIPATEATGTGTEEIRAGDFSTELQEERGGIAPGAEGAPRLTDRTGQPAERGALLEQEQADQAIAEDILARGEQEREDAQRRTTETLEAASATVSPTSELTDQQFKTGETLEAAGRVLRGEQASTLGPEAVAPVEGERGNVPTFRAVQDARDRVNGLLDKLEGVGSGGIEAARAVRERIEQRNLTGDQALGMLRGAEAFAETLPVDAKNVQLRFLDKVMLGAAAAEASGGGATAQEGPGRRLTIGNGLDGIIEVSLNQHSSVIRSTAAHEAFHVMQDVYADVDPGAANILNRAFGRPNETKRLKDLPSGIIRMLKKAEFAPGVSFWKDLTAKESANAAPIQSGELQAYSYQAYNLLKSQGKKVPGLGGAMSRYMIFNRKFFQRLGNSLRGDGFRTATEVFAGVPETARQRADGGVQSQTVSGEQASVLDRLARRATGVEQVQEGTVARRFGMRDVPDLIRQRIDADLPTQEITSLLEDTDVTSEQASALALRGMREIEPRLEEFTFFNQDEYSFKIDQPFSFDLDIAGTEDSTQVQHDFQMSLSRNPDAKWKDTYVAFTIDGSYSQQRDDSIEYLASRISRAADRGDFEKAAEEARRLTTRAAEKNHVDPTVNSPEFEALRDFASDDKSTRDKKVDDLKNLLLQQQRITKKHNTRVASELFPLASAMVARHIREDRPNIVQFSSSSKTGSRSRIYHKAGKKIADEYGYEVRTFYDDESERYAHQYILSPETAAQLDAFTNGLPEFLGMTEIDKGVFSESSTVRSFLADVLPSVVREGEDGINKFARNIKDIVEDSLGLDLVTDRLGRLDASTVRQIADLFGLTAVSKDLSVEEKTNEDADQSVFDRLRQSLFSNDGARTEQASTLALTMENLDQRIPQADRVASPNPRSPLVANSFTSILGGNGGGFNGNQADINRIFEESIAETDDDGGTTARDAVKAVEMRAPSADFWNKAFKMPNRVRYWYEASAEAFRDLTNFRSPEALSRFIDIVSGTSGGVEPYPNLMRAMGVASEDAQGIPIRTDLRDPASATKALAPSDLNTLKFGNFAGTMQFINGLTPKAPLSTNDTQVASAFGFPGTALASKPILYEVLSRFYQKLRDVQNSGIAAGEQPYESWQIQALGWVEERGRKKETKQNVSDDYGEALPKIISTLQANGVPVPGGQITETTLQDARVPNLMSGTRRYFDQGRFATVETASELTPEGKRGAEIYEYLRGREEIPWVRDAKKGYVRQQRIPMEKLARRKASGKINPKTNKPYGADPSLLSNIMSELVGTKVDVSRVDPRNFTGWGTFESVMSPNLRIPMQFRVMETQGFASLTPEARRALLAMLGKALGQKAMAASQFTPAADPANPDTFRVFVQTTDPANFNPTVIETFEKDAGGFPLNIEEVPNGYTIDLNIGGFDVGPNRQTVEDAVTKNLGNQDATIVPMDYASDYIEENGYVDTNGDFQAVDGYDSFINELLEQDDASEIRNDTRGVGRGNRVEARTLRSTVTRYAAQLEEISANRDDGFREWSDGVEGLLSKERGKEDERRAKQARIRTKDTLNAAKSARNQMRTTGEQASLLGYNPIFAAGARPRPIKTILSNLMPTNFKDFRQQMVNGFDPLADLEMRVNSGKLRDATKSAFKMAELSLQLTGRTESFLLNGPPVFNQETGGVSANTEIGGLKDIFEPIGSGEKYLRFQDYAYARRADELINDPMAQEIINPTTGKVSYPALDAARAELAQSTKFINGLKEQPRSPERDRNIKDFTLENQRFKNQVKRVEKSIEVKENLEESFPAVLRDQALALGNPEFDQVLDRYKAFNDSMLQYLVDTGLISEAQRDGMARTSLYVPFYKLADEDSKEMNSDVLGPKLRSGLSNPDAGIKALTGEGGQIGDLYENVIRNAQVFLGAGLRNEAMRRSVDLMGEAEIGGVQREKGPTTVTYKVGGQDKHYNIAKPDANGQIDPDAPSLFAALTSFSRPQTEGIIRVMETVSNIFRSGITISPGFMIANFIRGDLAGAVTTSGHLRPVIDSVIGLKAALTNNQSVQDLKQQSGVGGYAFGGRPKGFANQMKRDYRKNEDVVGLTTKMSDVLVNLWNKAEAVGEATELATREAIFRRLKDAGFNDVESAYQGLALVNYSRRGNPDSLAATALGQLIPLVPFLNARVQGLYRTASAVSGKEAEGKSTILKGMALTAASMSLYAASSGDDRWKEEPLERKLNYYIMYLGDKKILIPKPFEVGVIFSTIPEFFTDLVMGNISGKDAARAAKMTILNTFGFNPVPQALLPIIEVAGNYDSFTDRALETASVQRLPSGDRAYSTTSQTAIQFGKTTGLSPIKFENIINGYLGSMGSLGLAAVDSVLSATGAIPSKPAGIFENEIADAASFLTGLTRFVKESPDSANKFVGDFYELKREVDEIYAAVQDRRKNGEVEAALGLMRENRKKLSVRSSLSSMQKSMSTLNREIQRVKRTERMDSNQKKQRLQRLISQRNRVAGQTERILERIN